MITSTVTKTKRDNYPGYPCIMKGKKGTIILFCSESKGTVLNAPSTSSERVGFYYENWNMNSFEYYNDSVTLKNE